MVREERAPFWEYVVGRGEGRWRVGDGEGKGGRKGKKGGEVEVSFRPSSSNSSSSCSTPPPRCPNSSPGSSLSHEYRKGIGTHPSTW